MKLYQSTDSVENHYLNWNLIAIHRFPYRMSIKIKKKKKTMDTALIWRNILFIIYYYMLWITKGSIVCNIEPTMYVLYCGILIMFKWSFACRYIYIIVVVLVLVFVVQKTTMTDHFWFVFKLAMWVCQTHNWKLVNFQTGNGISLSRSCFFVKMDVWKFKSAHVRSVILYNLRPRIYFVKPK